MIAAYTGVAATNIGSGARTLTDLFRLAKCNEASGDLAPLEGDDLQAFVDDLEGVELLVIDEISMVSRVVLAQVHARLREWRLSCGRVDLAREVFGGIAVILAGDFGQLPPVAVSPSLSLLHPYIVREIREHKAANLGMRLLAGFDTVVRLRRVHRQAGASVFKESLIRTRDGAMTKEDHALWRSHDLADIDACSLSPEERSYFEDDVPHLFAENVPAGARNGFKLGQHASAKGVTILRVASGDSSSAAARQSHDQYGQLRRVVHLSIGAPVMLIANLRTSVGLVNGAMGRVVAAVLREGWGQTAEELRNAIPAGDVRYVIVDFPAYKGPVFFPGRPTWVPIPPLRVRHRRLRQWQRLQLPLALAWGLTIHKSQGLTFLKGSVVDFAHGPSYQPVAQVGLAFVGMSRCTSWSLQAFRNLPSFWEFRKVLQDPLFRWRKAFEENMDALHDSTMEVFKNAPWGVDDDLRAHIDWTVRAKGHDLTKEEVEDLRAMLAVRGVLPPPEYEDEPQPGPRGIRGGGGRKQKRGMQAPRSKRQVVSLAEPSQEHLEQPPDAMAGPFCDIDV